MKITAGRVVKTRAKLARTKPDKDPYHAAKRQAKSEALAFKLARKESEYKQNEGGHKIQVLRPNWASWPSTSTKLRAGTLLTCCACWRASNQDWDVKCVGRKGKVSGQSCALWRRLIDKNSDNIELLLSTWKASRAEADERFGVSHNAVGKEVAKKAQTRCGGYKGVRVGEASHPGPPCQTIEVAQFSLKSLNCGSAKGVWNFFNHCCSCSDLQVLALQETRFTETEELAFIRHAQKKGFVAHACAGEVAGRGRARGGVMWRLKLRKSSLARSSDSQVAAVWVEDFLLLNFYAPPDRAGDPQMQAAELLQNIFLEEQQPSKWVAVGDGNESPSDTWIGNSLSGFGGVLLEQGVPSRWEGRQELDWVHTAVPHLVTGPQFAHDHFSDHKALECKISIHSKNLAFGSLLVTPDWQKPLAAPVDWWRNTLTTEWNNLGISTSQLGSGTIDDHWAFFLNGLERMFRGAFGRAAEQGYATPLELARAMKAPGKKGHCPTWKQRTWPRAGPTGKGSMRLIRRLHSCCGNCTFRAI